MQNSENSCSQSMKNDGEEINIERLNNIIDEGQNFINKFIDNAIIVIGNTGSGKSTLINALVGKQLIVKTNPSDPTKAVIELAEEAKGLKIGHNSAISETSVPGYILDDNRVGYFDCPGFGDTKCDEQEIANAIFIKRIFEKVANVKIVVVAQEEEFTSTVGRGKLMINFINQLINMFPDVNELIRSLCLVVTKVEIQFNPRTKQQYQPTIEYIIEKLNLFKNQHQTSGISKMFQNETFAKIFDTFLLKERVELFFSPTGDDGEVIDFSKNIQQMINSIPYIKSPIINSSITPEVKLKLQRFYAKLHQDSKEQAKELKDCITQFLLKSQDFSTVLKMKVFVNRILSLKSQFEVINSKDILEETKTEYTTSRKQLEEFVQLEAKNTIEILKLIDFIVDVQLPPMIIFDFLFIEIDSINNDIYRSINIQKNKLIENFTQVTNTIKQIINDYSLSIEDENILQDLQVKLQESLTDDNQYLTKYCEVLENCICTQQMQEKSYELQQIYKQLQEIFDIINTNEQLENFPTNIILNSLTFSIIDIQQKLYELRQINLQKQEQQALEQKQIEQNTQLEENQKEIVKQKEEEIKKFAELQFQKEQELENLKKEEEIKEIQLKKEIEQKACEVQIIAENEKKEYESKLAEFKLNQEIAKQKQQKEEEEQKQQEIQQQIKMKQLQDQLNAQKKKKRKRKKFLFF